MLLTKVWEQDREPGSKPQGHTISFAQVIRSWGAVWLPKVTQREAKPSENQGSWLPVSTLSTRFTLIAKMWNKTKIPFVIELSFMSLGERFQITLFHTLDQLVISSIRSFHIFSVYPTYKLMLSHHSQFYSRQMCSKAKIWHQFKCPPNRIMGKLMRILVRNGK